MYFPTTAARQLANNPTLPNIPTEQTVALAPSPRKSLFCTLTRIAINVWSVRPSALLSVLTRTPISILNHGDNLDVWWSPDGNRIIVKTSDSFLVLISVDFNNDAAYASSPLPSNAQRNFLAGPGEALPFPSISLHFEGVVRVEGGLQSVSPRKQHMSFSTRDPPTIQSMPWPTVELDEDDDASIEQNIPLDYNTWLLNDLDFSWLVEPDVYVTEIIHAKVMDGELWITSDGRAYFVGLHEVDGVAEDSPDDHENDTEERQANIQQHWHGTCIHNFKTPKWVQKRRKVEPEDDEPALKYEEPRRATKMAVNTKFSLIAIGTEGGEIQFTNFPSEEGISPKSQQIDVPNPFNRKTGSVTALEWTSDGYVLAVGWEHGWGIFSVGGKCLASAIEVNDAVNEEKFQDIFMYGVRSLFWGPANFDLFVLAKSVPQRNDGQIFVIPFAKSATTGQHSPDNTRYAFLQMDDRALVYRGADQPDLSVINPESDVWQHIKIPQRYLALNWPIRYSSLSNDGRLIAVAGRRGLIHYSSTSGRWKIFAVEDQEQNFSVRGGLLWFHHVLVAAVEVSKSFQIRLYSRDMELTSQNILHREILPAPVVILSIVDNSLLAYTADNTLYHYLIVPTAESIKLHLCGSITFTGIVSAPGAVRMLSWMIPSIQKQIGDPINDLSVATVLMVVGGQLILLRPRKSASDEVKYDIQVLAERIEFCWIHLRGVGALENSLWAYDAQGMRVWLNALSIESPPVDDPDVKDVKESVKIPLDFYPLSVLMDKGIIIGIEHEAAVRTNLPFALFRHATSSYLFLQHILLYHLENKQISEAVTFASHYKNLVFFAHALEILLHTVVESDLAGASSGNQNTEETPNELLPTVIEFLDHFDVALDVVVGCARKTEPTRWRQLFNVVGNPKGLFETCLATNRLKTAGSYLLVLHNLEQLDENSNEAIRLLMSAVKGKDWQLCRELLRFLRSIDDTGQALRNALKHVDIGGMNVSVI
ncbi:Guanine nucleotide exchange factor subunit Rich [Psilocybe cubensis]|uniref:Guanine nucleotide exchange factor subunit Rich n=2 Tax=Psilocybe cubensis TaxID=181762 RepID=A0ACB8HFG3_PSICU|nr:Guanine nucleotide exchange factor subunit Rich [Psilocybe cubensis]KAH9486681.1 Guanine nucleotide exchange factor subunit Rich [Psilocybe cubensis]